MTPPIALLIFNRPSHTRQVWQAIRSARPRQLFVVADGPRPDHPGEAERCRDTRRVLEAVDWPCDVRVEVSETNLGCRRRVASGITWVFQQVEAAIILEDDCVPHPTFFPFCGELLERYRASDRVMAVTGNNFLMGQHSLAHSYYFSRYAHVWGWASWRRAWDHYRVDMPDWPMLRDRHWLEDQVSNPRSVRNWRQRFESSHSGALNSWDFQWQFACWKRGGLVIHPALNLVKNIGFGADATHTLRGDSPLSGLEAKAMRFPLRHPPSEDRDVLADQITEATLFHVPRTHLAARLWRGLRRVGRRAVGIPFLAGSSART